MASEEVPPRVLKFRDPRWDDTPTIEYTVRTVYEVTMSALISPDGKDRQELNRFLGNFQSEDAFIEFATLDRVQVVD